MSGRRKPRSGGRRNIRTLCRKQDRPLSPFPDEQFDLVEKDAKLYYFFMIHCFGLEALDFSGGKNEAQRRRTDPEVDE
jgi:hypothetical protein